MESSFPRVSKGYIDTGQKVPGTEGQRCPNCNSIRYRQTVSTEDCPDCGLHCNYWDGGANKVYEDMMARNHATERAAEEQRETDEWLAHTFGH